MPDSDEIYQLEQTLARLDHELSDARRALVALRMKQADLGSSAPVHAASGPSSSVFAAAVTAQASEPPPSAGVPTPRPSPDTGKFIEQLVGRYGALSLAVITIIMGAGALVSWALRQGLLTPWVRVLLGSLLAAALAAAGIVLRGRSARRFGHTLLALSLAVVHVVAWGAGPRLALVPAWASLAIAAAASVLLSALALHDENEELFAVGVGGALLAPFVQRSGAEHFVLLAAYGVVVTTASLRTVAARPWRLVAAIMVLAACVYASALNGYHGDNLWLNRELAVGFALVLAVAALVLTRSPLRPWIALAFLAIMIAAGDTIPSQLDMPLAKLTHAPDQLAFAMTGAAFALYAARALPMASTMGWASGALILPVAFLLKAMFYVAPAVGAEFGGVVHAAVAAIWVLWFAVAALSDTNVRRGVLMAASGIVATWAAVLAASRWPHAIPAACALVAIVGTFVSRREDQPIVLVAAAVAAAVGYQHGMQSLIRSSGFGVPFTSTASLALALFVAELVVASRLVRSELVTVLARRISPAVAAQVVVGVACFLWWRAELARAFSADAATFLLIVYYAASGVVVLWQGRAIGSQRLRQTGLALSIWAAVVALASAFAVEQIALRVGSYLGVGVFLLGVAWWYRAGQELGAGNGA